jgi:hydrogenase expression/formation protein HypE
MLKDLVFTHLGKRDPDLILGPGIGQDACLIRFGDRILVAATDPITGSIEDAGWLSVHVNANDIATFGVAPRWFLNSIMLPETSDEDDLAKIMQQIHRAAASLGISVAGGHTEITQGLDRPIIAGFMLGLTEPGKYVTSSGARSGDAIIMTKTAAIEGTAILASEGRGYLSEIIGEGLVENAVQIRDSISVVEEGIAAFQTGYVTAMHDPTEGGIVGGLHEMCDASGVGFKVDLESIPLHPATTAICDTLGVNWLNLISSGCMLITCSSTHAEEVVHAIEENGLQATIIGRIVDDSTTRLLVEDDESKPVERYGTDALWDALKILKERKAS